MNPKKLKRDWKKACGAAENNPNASALWERIDEINREAMLVRPANSFTANEYGIKYGITANNAKFRLLKLVSLGKVRRHKAPGSNLVYWTLV